MVGLVVGLVLLNVFYFAALPFVVFKAKKLSPKVFNLCFAFLIFALYLVIVVERYLSVGSNDWNFLNALPTANVSPFVFALCPIVVFLPQKVKKYAFALFALLCVGMLASFEISLTQYIVKGWVFHYFFLLDALAHCLLSLFGVYLVSSKQVELDKKHTLIGGSVIVVVALVMLVLNAIFHTSFFGLGLYGNHSIYGFVLSKSSAVSALAYFAGLLGILLLGFGFQKLLCYIQRKCIERGQNKHRTNEK